MELGPSPGVLRYAHPGLLTAASRCRNNGKIYPWHDFLNESGHLHWRTRRLRWIRGDVWPRGFPRALGMLCDSREAFAEPTVQSTCAWALAALAQFYIAWRHLLQALRKGAESLMLEGLTRYAMYLQMKPDTEPLLLQEEQFALLFRMVHTILNGAYASPCSCQFQHVDEFHAASRQFKLLFRREHVRPGPLGDESRDQGLIDLRSTLWCDWRAWPTYQQFVPPVTFMLHPDADMITSSSGCFPQKILGSILCGQSAMVLGKLHVARDYFTGAMTMLLFSLDCFDTAVSILDATSLFDLLRYMARLQPPVAPVYPNTWHLGLDAEGESVAKSASAARQTRHSRTMLLRRQMVAARLPPLCLDGQGSIALRVEGLATEGRYFVCDTSGSWSFIPVRVPLPKGVFAEDGHIAKILRVDSASWSNLGHSIMFLVPHFASAFSSVYKTGGLEAVWKKRRKLRVYLYLPREGRLMLPEPKRPAILVPWLELLSDVPPVLFIDSGHEEVERTPLPLPVQLADSKSTRCHSSGEWGGPAPLTGKEDLDLFIEIARGFPAWQQHGLALLHSVWGRGSLDEAYRDPCLVSKMQCLRVLFVQRGNAATSARRIVNVDKLVEWVESQYSPNRVRMAVVNMEKYKYAEEIYLASHVDILIGAFGSGMWWGIFMPPGGCVLWLSPWLHQPHLQMHEHHWSTARSAPRGPLWGTTSYLEYRDLRDLWHVQIHGGLPPPGTEGNFASASPDTESYAGMGFMLLDIFVDMNRFIHAFEGMMRQLSKRNASRWANMSKSPAGVV